MSDVDAFRDAEFIGDVSGIAFEDEDAEPGTPVVGADSSHIKKVRAAAKIAYLDQVMKDLDIFIYCQLSALYYMDCSIVLFILRAVTQFIFFTPKAPPFEPTRNQAFIGAIFFSNLFCMIFHIFLIRPEAGEATRGYLHGGLFIDFIGQKPAPIARLLCFDTLILLIDFLMLALIVERVNTVGPRSLTSPNINTSSSNIQTDSDPNSAQSNPQDHDAEERGVIRGHEDADANTPNDSTPLISAIDYDVNEERTTLLADPGEDNSGRDGHPLDSFISGQAVLVDAGLFTIIRSQWLYSMQRPANYSPSPQMATFLRRRLGLQIDAEGQPVRVTET
ncbi:hypothetical protein N7495_009405 [Penicillium taxi]|uniref:uncharacterized protein n=1 Tax=Penicillium taxi TaxID=168475 RepID=UPI002545A76D|nr:uncharacterized protein N7495_009405 [Penicillium taxi]KAJ5884895.1 hypothetical protein N7495_009405 [Penicillium taxi]